MDRDEMIKALKGLKGYKIVELTMTYDMGLQIDYATSEGIGTNIGNFGDWPLLKFVNKGLSASWDDICKNIEADTLTHDMLKNTTIYYFLEGVENRHGQFEDGPLTEDSDAHMSLSEFLKPLIELSPEESEEFYIFFDCCSWELSTIQVYKDDASAWSEVRDRIGHVAYTKWEDLNDKRLYFYYKELENRLNEGEFDGIKYSEYDPENDE